MENSGKLDGNNDGIIDNICFIIKGQPSGWGDLLWPHMSTLFDRGISINGKQVGTYNLQIEQSMGKGGHGVLCHELFHSMGAPDLYHYNHDGNSPVGLWDIMEANANPPQHMGAYMKYKYGGWIQSIPEIKATGTYYLKPLISSNNNCYKIASPNSDIEYFVLEYRKKASVFENSLPDEGLLIYRINPSTSYSGNASGPPDEVYIFRPDGNLTENGNPNKATFSSNYQRTSINDNSNPYTFLSDGLPGGLEIENIGMIGDSIAFTFKKGNAFKLALTSPNGGEFFTMNSKISITWLNAGTSKIKIEYSIDEKNWELIEILTNQAEIKTGNYIWTLPNLSAQTVKVKISDADDQLTYSISKQKFSISSKGRIYETEPNDIASKALMVAIDEIIEGEITTKDDVDYYKFSAIEGDTIDIYAQALNSSLIGKIRIYSNDGSREWRDGIRDYSWEKEHLPFIAPYTGEYYLKYSQAGNFGIFPNSVVENIDTMNFQKFTDSNQLYDDPRLQGRYLITIRKFVPAAAIIETAQAEDKSVNSATLTTRIFTNGSPTCVSFNYGETTDYGNTIEPEFNCYDIFNQSWHFNAPISGLKPNTTYHFRAIARNNDGTTYGNDVNFKTAEEPTDWERLIVTENYNGYTFKTSFNSLIELDKKTQIIIGGTNLLRTIDGGKHWEKILEHSTIIDDKTIGALSHGVFINMKQGWIVGNNILKSNDGGISWKHQYNPTDKFLQGVSFIDESRGIAVGLQGIILRTTDGGNRWVAQDTLRPDHSWFCLNDVQMIDKNLAYAVGDFGTIIKTTDGGNSWIELKNGISDKHFRSLHFLDSVNGYITVAGSVGIIRTTDGGQTWSTQNNVTGKYQNGIDFYDENRGIMVGGGGSIAVTKNGGNTWEAQESGYRDELNDVKFIDSTTAIVVGSFQTILKTIDLTKKELTLLSPFGGEVWEAGSVHEIIWQKNNVSKVHILFSHDIQNNHWDTIATNVLAAVNSHKWLIPNIGSKNCKIKIFSVEDEVVKSECDLEFSIKNFALNQTPFANAGSDQSVNERAAFSLDGSASNDPDGNPLTYKWTAPVGITLSSNTSLNPTFTAPEVSVDTNYTFSLVVNDGTVDSPVDSVIITVININEAPLANAGPDQSVDEGVTISLDGSLSSDSDGNPLTFKWTAPVGITLSSTAVAKPTFTAPEVSANTNYSFSLVVNDGTIDSPADQVVITVKHVNKAPVANAGTDQLVNEGSIVTLDGSASFDPDGNPLTFKWTSPVGITLSSTTVGKPTFTAPEGSANTNYKFSLMVNDGTVDSPVDEVVITVLNLNKVPIANAGNDQSVIEGNTVTLDGSASLDPDGNPLTFKWTAPGGITLSSTTDAKSTFTAPEVSEKADYTFTLVVNDGTVDSQQDQVVITVLPGISSCPVEVQNDVEPDTGTSGPRYGQSITINKTGILEKIKLTIWPDGPGNPHLILREWASDIYENAFDGKIVATSNVAINKPSVSNWTEMSTFTFPSQPELTGGKKYTIEVIDASPYVKIPGTYSGGMAYETLNPDFDRDMRFAIHLCVGVETGFGKFTYENDIRFYPNPSTGIVNYEIDYTVWKNAEITVYNGIGEKVWMKRNLKDVTGVIDLSRQVSGIYFIRFNSGGETKTTKLVLKRD